MSAEQYFGTNEAARQLDISPTTLRRYCLDGTLPEPGWLKIGKKRQRSYSATWIANARRTLDAL